MPGTSRARTQIPAFAWCLTHQDLMAARHKVPGPTPVPDTKCRDSHARRNRSCRRGSSRTSAAHTRAGLTPKRDFSASTNTLSRPAPTGHGLALARVLGKTRTRAFLNLRQELSKETLPGASTCRAPAQAPAETFSRALQPTGPGSNGDSGNGSGSKSSQKSA